MVNIFVPKLLMVNAYQIIVFCLVHSQMKSIGLKLTIKALLKSKPINLNKIILYTPFNRSQ